MIFDQNWLALFEQYVRAYAAKRAHEDPPWNRQQQQEVAELERQWDRS